MKSALQTFGVKAFALSVAVFVQVAEIHAQISAGTVVAWGDNSFGQADVPLGLTNATAVSAGFSHGLALNRDGTVIAWGDDSCNESIAPAGLSNVMAVAAGGWFNVALRNDGTIVNWGCNNNGVQVPGTCLAIAAGWDHGLALESNHTVVGWGYNGQGEANVPAGLSNVVAIAAGNIHNLAILSDSTVFAWGDNSAGQTNVPVGLSNVVAIAAGYSHSLALKSDGTVIAWGDNSSGQTNVPPGLSNVLAIAAGDYFNLALKSDGIVIGWGDNSTGQTSVPLGLTNAVAIAAGYYHGLAIIKNNGSLFIGQQPFSQTLYNGQTCYLKTIAIGTPPLSYQWLFNGTNINGATNALLTLPNVQQTNSGNYIVVVSDAYGTVTSSNSILRVVICPPIITYHSPNQLALLGTNLTLTVSAIGPVPMSYQWQFNGTNILDATNASLSVTNFQDVNEGNYSVVVSNAFYSTNSANIYLEAGDLWGALDAINLSWRNDYFNRPWWYWETTYTHDGLAAARSGGVGNGGKSSLSTTVNGPGTLSFWWMISSDVPDTLTFSVNGASQAYLYDGDPYHNINWYYSTFYLPAGTQNLDWTYARNSSVNIGLRGGVLDQVTYTPGPTLPIITTAPADQSVPATSSATFTVAATGTPPLSYQWQFNGTNILGATNTSLTLTGVQATNAGLHGAVVSNPYGTNTPTAVLTVIPVPPQIVTQPGNQRSPVNGNATFSVAVTGSVPFVYQWQLNGTNIDGATNPVLTLTGVQTTDAGDYQALISNDYGVTNSAIAILTVARFIAWGYNGLGQTTIPLALTNAASTAGGLYHSLALNFDGTVTAWGNNSYRQTNTPVGLVNVAAIAAGFYHNLALKSDSTVVAWGAGTNIASAPNLGQCMIPADLSNVVAVAGGGYHSLALKSDGTVVAWGAGTNNTGLSPNYGQSKVPSGLSNIVSIAAGAYHSLALKSDGTVVAWGAGTNSTGSSPNYGQSKIPTNLSNVVAIAAGAYHSLALKSDGTLLVWGNNTYGQTNVPAGLSNVVAIACGGYHNLALKSDGTLLVWGNNTYGQTNVPAGLSNVVVIAGGVYHSLAIMNDGSPFIIKESANQTIYAGSNISLSVSAVGAPVLSYQWQFNGTNIDGATNAVLTLTNLPTTSSGGYQCIVSNVFGVITSAPVSLNVLRTIPLFAVSSPALYLSSGGFNLQLNNLSGHGLVIIYASTNLTHWQPIFTNPPIVGTLPILDSSATNLPFQFYRAMEQ